MLQIRPLHESPHYAPILAWWSYMEWYRKRDITFDLVLKSYQSRAKKEGVPFSCIALYSGLPVGMASLKENDLWSRKDLNPWLASLYVHPEYRGLGIGTDLIAAVCEQARGQGYTRLYLYRAQKDSKKLEGFYEKRDWRYFEKAEDNDGSETIIYYHDL